MSIGSSSESQTSWSMAQVAAAPIAAAPTTAELITDLQKYKDNLPERYSAGNIGAVLTEIVSRMEACAKSFPDVTTMRNPIYVYGSSTKYEFVKKANETPSRVVSFVKLQFFIKSVYQGSSDQSDAIVIVNAQKIHIFSLKIPPLLHFEMPNWSIGGESLTSKPLLKVNKDYLANHYIDFLSSSGDVMQLDTTGKIIQLFIDQTRAALDFITNTGIERARFPTSRKELLKKTLQLLYVAVDRDSSTIVVSYIKDELVKPSILGLPDDSGVANWDTI